MKRKSYIKNNPIVKIVVMPFYNTIGQAPINNKFPYTFPFKLA